MLAAGSCSSQQPPCRSRRYADGIGAPVGGPERPLRQQPDLQRLAPEPVLRERRHPVGLRLGPVPRPHLRPARARRGERRARRHPVQRRPTRSRSSPTTSARSRSPAAGGRPAPASTDAARSRSTPSARYIDASAVYGGTPRPAGLAARGLGRRQPGQQRRHAAAARTASCRGATPAATRPPRRRWTSTAGCAASPTGAVVAGDVRANENIALTATHTLFAREHNRIVGAAARATLTEEDEVPDRPAGRRSPSSSTSPTTSSCRRSASRCRRYRGYNPNVNADARQRVRHGRLPGAQPDPRRVRGRGRRAAATRQAELDGLRGAGRRGRRIEDDEVELAIPLNVAFFNPDLLDAVSSARAAGPRPRAAVQERRADRQPAAQRAVPGPGRPATRRASTARRCPSASTASSTSAPSTSSAAATTACRATTSCGAAYGLPPKTSFTRDHRRVDRALPGRPGARPGDRSTTRTASTSSRCSTSTANPIELGDRGGRRRRRSAASAAPRSPPGCRRSTATSTTSTPSSAWSPSRTSPAPSSASCSWRSGRKQFQALRDGDRFFYGNDPGLS